MFVELVLAPGVTDSESSLSCPYTNELVNSLIKARAYIHVGSEDAESFSAHGGLGAFDANCDFRKRLHISTHLGSDIRSLPYNALLWGCKCRGRWYPGTVVSWIPLVEFDMSEFKLVNPSPWLTDCFSNCKSCRWLNDVSKQRLSNDTTLNGLPESSLSFVTNPESVPSQRFIA